MHNIFYILLLEQNTKKKKRVDKNITHLEFKANNNEEYKIEGICDSVVYKKNPKPAIF